MSPATGELALSRVTRSRPIAIHHGAPVGPHRRLRGAGLDGMGGRALLAVATATGAGTPHGARTPGHDSRGDCFGRCTEDSVHVLVSTRQVARASRRLCRCRSTSSSRHQGAATFERGALLDPIHTSALLGALCLTWLVLRWQTGGPANASLTFDDEQAGRAVTLDLWDSRVSSKPM